MTIREARKNVAVSYGLLMLSELYLPVSIWLYFFLDFLTFSQIAFLTMVQVLAGVVFELPTGAIADLLGRKKSLLGSFAITGLALLCFVFTRRFEIFVVLEIFRGLGNALFSGTLEALVYDSLEETNMTQSYDKIVSNQESIAWLALFLGAILGSFLFSKQRVLPYLVQGILYLLIIPIILQLKEPKRKWRTISAKEFVRQNIRGVMELFKSAKVSLWSSYFVIVGIGYFVAASILGISQAKELNLGPTQVGWLFGVGYIGSALASQTFGRLKKKLGERLLLMGTTGVLLFSLLAAKFVGVVGGSALILLRIASSTTFRNLRSSVINKFISSENRASAISSMMLLTSLPYALGAVFMGEYVDMTSPNQLALLLGVSMLIILVLLQLGYSLSKILR